tara:strand:+ start:248 stop:589 length:342 start_codon:yes stop_codon:yes gene_type:complete
MTDITNKGKYHGIADCHGLESFVAQAGGGSMMKIRAAANPQRSATYYTCELEQEHEVKMAKLMEDSEWIYALEYLKELQLPNLVAPDNPEAWSAIPNPELDPMYRYEEGHEDF